MDRKEAEGILKKAHEQRQRALEIMAEQEEIAAGLRLVIQGIVKLYPDLDSEEYEWGEASDDKPRGAAACRIILEHHRNAWLTVPMILRELRDRDWMPASDNPSNAVRAALTRLIANKTPGITKSRGDSGLIAYRFESDTEEPF